MRVIREDWASSLGLEVVVAPYSALRLILQDSVARAIRRLKKGFIYRFFMKIADKLESPLKARKTAWEFRARDRKWAY